MSGWLSALVATASVLFGGGGLAVLVTAVTGRRLRRVEVVDRLADATLKWVEQFQEDTAAARIEATSARRELAEVRREFAEVRHEAENLARDLRNLRGAIMAPNATIERLRTLVGGSSGDHP